MKAVIVSHGDIKDFKFAGNIMRDCDLIVCADGGGEYAVKCGILPGALIGDLDSIDKDILEEIKSSGCTIVQYPREKDYTDTQLAIDYAISKGANELVLLGSTGDRLDHSLANIFLLVKLSKQNIKASIVNEKNTIYITRDTIELQGNPGELLTLLPVGGDVNGIYTQGLQYRLSGQNIRMGEPLGISNVFTDRKASIKIDSGFLLVIKSFD
jgi:thiamine pyrophosphokinase